MTGLLKERQESCREIRMQLEDAASAALGAKEVKELLSALPPASREHADSCAECRVAAENILAARTLLAALPSNAALGGPWFTNRVMAAIAARKAELSRAADTWTFLPKLAARLIWACSIALLLASGWLYQRPAANPPKVVLTDITGEPLVDNPAPANDDELLLSLAEKAEKPR